MSFGNALAPTPPADGKFGSETENSPPLSGHFGAVFGPYLAQESGFLILQENTGRLQI